MSKKSSKLLVGCGIVLALFVVIIIIGVFTVYTFVKSASEDVEKIKVYKKAMVERFGGIEDFTPPSNQLIDPSRLMLFIDIRDSLTIQSENLVDALEEISDKTDEEGETSFWESLGIVKTGFTIVPRMLDYYILKNGILVRYNMSLGEYNYYYVLSYYSFLKKSPENGPPFEYMSTDDGGAELNLGNDHEKKENYIKRVKESRKKRISGMVNEQFQSFLTNQLSLMNLDNEFYKVVETELNELKNNSERIPWEGGLPNQLEKTFSQFRQKLENNYVSFLNPIDFEQLEIEP